MADQKDDDPQPRHPKPEDNESDVSSESEDEDLVLEGELVRHPDAPPSSDEDDDEKQPAAERPKKRQKQDETLQVEFTFHDMHEKFFHGLKSLLNNSSTIYQPQASSLVDAMVDNIAVGTVLSTEGGDDTVFGFASVLNVTTYQSGIQHLKKACLAGCPADRKQELQVVLSGDTKRPAGFLLHGRMINLPLEVVLVLQQQLVLDMDWAVKNAQGGPEKQKSLDFGVFVRLAPCQKESNALVYRYFEDEVLAGQADFCFCIDAPNVYSQEEKQYLNVLVLTKAGHRAAMTDLERMVGMS